jgi:quercetin dioxygenase-like cupin family protein
MSDRYEDARGVIQDLFDGEPVDAVTHITTLKGAIRGNHYHEHTTQWTLVLSGRLLIANPAMQKIVRPGEMVTHVPGDPHAWKALEDASCLVFTRGPRSGADYESDTYRLDEPLLT